MKTGFILEISNSICETQKGSVNPQRPNPGQSEKIGENKNLT